MQPTFGLRQMHAKTSRFPDLKLEVMPDESDLGGDAGIGLDTFAQVYPPSKSIFKISLVPMRAVENRSRSSE